jgi:hypothetical protein
VTADLWRDAEKARAAGDKPAARALLLRIVAEQPHHVAALKTLTALAASDDERRRYEEKLADATVEADLDIVSFLREQGQTTKAETLARRSIAARPTSPRAHRVLFDLLRAEGRLDDARAMERSMPAWTGEGAPLPAATCVLLDDFLPPDRHRAALDFALAQRETVEQAMVVSDSGQWEIDREARVARTAYDVAPLRDWFVPLIEARVAGLAHELQRPAFPLGEVELQFTAYNDGEFYRVHADQDEETLASRRLSFIYYFNRAPKAFTGGDLLLFDTDEKTSLYAMRSFTRVAPRDNRLVVFPSYLQHEVAMVHCPSRAYEDSRFTFNGWIRCS